MSNNINSMDWDSHTISRLVNLWMVEHWSASLIGRELGCSRSAVLGKLNRLDLLTHGKYQRKQPKKRLRSMPVTPVRESRRRSFKDAPEPPAMPVHAVTVAELDPHHCRWPIGTPAVLFCGEHKLAGYSYCPAHCRKAYTPARPMRADTIVTMQARKRLAAKKLRIIQEAAA